jgi:hypothetical protein
MALRITRKSRRRCSQPLRPTQKHWNIYPSENHLRHLSEWSGTITTAQTHARMHARRHTHSASLSIAHSNLPPSRITQNTPRINSEAQLEHARATAPLRTRSQFRVPLTRVHSTVCHLSSQNTLLATNLDAVGLSEPSTYHDLRRHYVLSSNNDHLL